MIFPVAHIGKLSPKIISHLPGCSSWLRPIRGAMEAPVLGPHPEPDPRLCLTDDLSCRQSIGSSSGGEGRTKHALWPAVPSPGAAASGTPSGTPGDAPRPTAV